MEIKKMENEKVCVKCGKKIEGGYIKVEDIFPVSVDEKSRSVRYFHEGCFPEKKGGK